MAKTLGRDPTANAFALLVDESVSFDTSKPEKKKKQKPQAAEPAVIPTPAAKAQARKAKEEEDKAKKAAEVEQGGGGIEESTGEDQQNRPPPKLNRTEWEQQKRKGKPKEGSEGADQANGPRNLPPRQQGQGGERGGRRGGGGGRDGGGGGERGGRGRGRGRGREGGGDSWNTQRLDENRNWDVYQRGQNLSEGKQAPRGREFDRKSGMKTSRFPQNKRGGTGRGNWGENTEGNTLGESTEQPPETNTTVVNGGWGDENEPAPTTNVAVDGWGETVNTNAQEGQAPTEEGEADTSAPHATHEGEEKDNNKYWDHYLDILQKEKEKLEALVGTVELRKVDTVEVPSTEPEEEDEDMKLEKSKRSKKSKQPKQQKQINTIPDEDLQVKFGLSIAVPPSHRGRGRGRGGSDGDSRGDFRGGRGRRGRGGEGGRQPRDDRPRDDRPRDDRPRDDRPRGGGNGGRNRGGQGRGGRGGRRQGGGGGEGGNFDGDFPSLPEPAGGY